MMFVGTVLAVASALLALSQPARAVCAPGEIAIGREAVRFDDIIGTRVVYEGIAMNNACGVLAKTNFAEDSGQVCNGGWNAALAVSCTNGVPTSAIGQGPGISYTCSPTTDTSCNSGTTGTVGVSFQVVACCSSNN